MFEAGATTLTGFDEHQPLHFLEKQTGITIPRQEVDPAMSIFMDGKQITRYKDRELWMQEAIKMFGNSQGQRTFWELVFEISDAVWQLSLNTPFFPPKSLREWLALFRGGNQHGKMLLLRYAKTSVLKLAQTCEVATPEFVRFLDEQLMITAQAPARDTPVIYGAPALAYTNYSNFYVPGGIINMIETIRDFIITKGGDFKTKEPALAIARQGTDYLVETKKNNTYRAPVIVSNIPLWNMPELTEGEVKSYFEKESEQYQEAWSALTMGIVTTDAYPAHVGIHHQIHLPVGARVPFTESSSIFVSISKRGDIERAPEGYRVLNLSTHARPDVWFNMQEDYEESKRQVHAFLIEALTQHLPGFADAEIIIADLATPVSWEQWLSRKKGRVGGIPQSMARGLLDWTPNQTPFAGFYLVGDTTFPGQGIPGVTLSGINVYSRIKKYHPKSVSA